MKAKITVEINFKSPSEASTILKALLPDNTPIPTGMELEMNIDGCKMNIFLSYTGNLNTLISTLDDILSNMKVVSDITEITEKI